MTEKLIPWGRLALRAEGRSWNAYYAPKDRMDGAILVGSIDIQKVQRPEQKRAFMALMQDAISELLKVYGYGRPRWQAPKVGPAHERGGNA